MTADKLGWLLLPLAVITLATEGQDTIFNTAQILWEKEGRIITDIL